jgi:hypothetical protein
MSGIKPLVTVGYLFAAVAAAPQIVGQDARLDEVCFVIDQGSGPARACFWGMNIEVKFDEPLYLCKINGTTCDPSGATVPIGDVGRIPSSPAYSHATHAMRIASSVAGDLYPLHVATAGAFRVDCAQPDFEGIEAFLPSWSLRGRSPAGPVNMILRNSNATLPANITGVAQPEVTSLHGNGLFDNGTAKCAEVIKNQQSGFGAVTMTVTDGCTDLPDFTMAPFVDQCPITQQAGDPYYRYCPEAGHTPAFLDFFCGQPTQSDLISYFCFGGKTVWSWKESLPYAFITPPTKDNMFEYTIMRSSTYQIDLSPVEPNSFKLILLLPDEFATKQAEYVQKFAKCEPRVTFGDMTKHSTPYGPMPAGKMPFEPNFITGADGGVASGSVSFPHWGLEEVSKCDSANFQVLGAGMTKMVDELKQAVNSEAVHRLTQGVNSMAAHSTIAACQALMDKLVNKTTVEQTVPATRHCQVPHVLEGQSGTQVNPAWRDDCRCNHALHKSQCCAPSEATRTMEVIDAMQEEQVVARCRHPDEIKLLLRDAVAAGSSGFMSDVETVIQNLHSKVREPLDTCRQEMEQEQQCTQDSDCNWGKKCTTEHGSSRCKVSMEDRLPGFITCFFSSLEGEIKGFVDVEMGLPTECKFVTCPDGTYSCAEALKKPNTSMPCYQTLYNKFLSDYTRETCWGHSAHLYSTYGSHDPVGCVSDGWCLTAPHHERWNSTYDPVTMSSWNPITEKMADNVTCGSSDGQYACFKCGSHGDCHMVRTHFNPPNGGWALVASPVSLAIASGGPCDALTI